jgi:autotransporter adhesin
MSENISARGIGLAIAIDGRPVPGATSFELVQESPFSAARFRLIMAMNAPGVGVQYYAGLVAATITVTMTVTSGLVGGNSVFQGQIDAVMLDVGAGLALLTGRDFAARLIDAEINESFSNQTSSAIAGQFARAAGLAANIKSTTQPIGQYYELAHNGSALGLHSRHPTQWDLLVDLAEIEGFALGVQGSTLIFGPVPLAPPMVLNYGQNVVELTVDRALGLLSPSVTIRSWNPRLQGAFTATSGGSGGLGVTLVKPNLTHAQVQARAQFEQARLAAQSVLLRAVMPGEFTLGPTSLVNVQGTGSSIDGLYQLRSIERRIAAADGFTQRIEATQVI